jgi:uncharacterized protein YeaO (DUF488 family)
MSARPAFRAARRSDRAAPPAAFQQFANQYRAERGGADTVNWNRLIEVARQERLGLIDEKAAEEERRALEAE